MEIMVDTENGFVEIINNNNTNLELKRNGSFITTLPKSSSYKDYTVESGKQYVYSLGSTSKSIIPYFEYIFLSDANIQLKIKYNSKVTGFKETILEQKIETIGNKYPFIFRNQDVRYKEIQLSGLISYLMDDEDVFDLSIEEKDISLSNKNFYKERKFREKCYAWLTNGKPKLFRSAQEGNCVIQLTNVSITPMEQLGRLLYSFSATGYEVMASDLTTLLNNNLALGVIGQ